MGWLSRRPSLDRITRWWANCLAWQAIVVRKVRKANQLDKLGRQWQKAFGGAKQNPITGQDENTVYGEIHVLCPLRDTGDVQACYKMMQFDRKVAEHAGGQFVVLQSQSNSGQDYCKVAMRMANDSITDLPQAHEAK